MNADLTRTHRLATAPVPGPHRAKTGRATDAGYLLPEGNRVLESIARQEALNGLLAFSGFHAQARKRRLAAGGFSDGDLFETERFILDEVLQIICDRIHAMTHCDGIVVALAEGWLSRGCRENGSKPERSGRERSTPEFPAMVCRASAGPLAVERDVALAGESELLQECLKTGHILACDDCECDLRVEWDSARQLVAGSTLLIPLRGQGVRVGVLQVFSRTPYAFADCDVRRFDLFAEMILSALKPEDQDRRIQWLAEVAGEVLRAKPAAGSENAAVAERVAAPPFQMAQARIEETAGEETRAADTMVAGSFLRRPSYPARSHPGIGVVMGLVAVAALFSTGAWWGMELHGKAAITRVATLTPAARTLRRTNVPSPAVSDNLMSPSQVGADAAPLPAAAQDKLSALPKITGLRHWSSSLGSTVVIDMEDQVPYEVHRLISPERIYFDLHDTVLAKELNGKTIEVGDPALTRVRVAQPIAGVTRIVLDTQDGANFSVSMESNPYRLVVELGDSGNAAAANRAAVSQSALNQSALNQSAVKQAAPKLVSPNRIVADQAIPIPSHGVSNQDISIELGSKRPALSPSLSLERTPSAAPVAAVANKNSGEALPTEISPVKTLPARPGKFRIVLDPGHGGWDLGTVGRQGLLEKNLVLDVTQRLGKLLQARLGTEVMYTRTDDTYLTLDQRADFANHEQADLFVSVHANYSSSASARGVETYYTNMFAAPGSREAEQHDDGTFASLTPVSLPAEGLHEKIEESRRLAASVQHSLYSTLAANNPNIRNRGIKDSAFVVLTGTTMPAILTEISFVSSPADERSLQSEAYRQRIAEALYQGIARYEASAPRTKVAQLQKPAVH